MIDAVCGDAGAALRLGENEGALENGLRVQRQRSGAPFRRRIAVAHRGLDVGFKGCRVVADACVACRADGRGGLVTFLHHGADKAGEFRHAALQQRLAEFQIADDARQRIGMCVIGGGRKQRAGDPRPVVRRRDAKLFLAFEMVEERALGDARRSAQLVNRGGRIALGADQGQGCIQQLLPCILSGGGFRHDVLPVNLHIPTGRYVVNRKRWRRVRAVLQREGSAFARGIAEGIGTRETTRGRVRARPPSGQRLPLRPGPVAVSPCCGIQ